jgi:hypothetical protein
MKMAVKTPEAHERKRKRFRDWYAVNRDEQLPIQRERMKQDRLDNPDKFWARDLWNHHKMTVEEYNRCLEEQDNVCALCHQPERAKDPRTGKIKRLAVDHDHRCCHGKNSCGRCNRGLVCRICNEALIKIDQDQSWLQRVLKYLKE